MASRESGGLTEDLKEQWKARYPNWADDGSESLLIPNFPAYTATDFRSVFTLPDGSDSFARPAPEVLDELFQGETCQRVTYGGLRTYQVNLLNNIAAYTPLADERNPAVESWVERAPLTINEDEWYRVFRRDRWLNFDEPIKGWPGKTWSVDDDEVWDRLRPIIELANRYLKRALKHEWYVGFYVSVLVLGHIGTHPKLTPGNL